MLKIREFEAFETLSWVNTVESQCLFRDLPDTVDILSVSPPGRRAVTGWQNGVKSEAKPCECVTGQLTGRRQPAARDGCLCRALGPQWRRDALSRTDQNHPLVVILFKIRKHLWKMSRLPNLLTEKGWEEI